MRNVVALAALIVLGSAMALRDASAAEAGAGSILIQDPQGDVGKEGGWRGYAGPLVDDPNYDIVAFSLAPEGDQYVATITLLGTPQDKAIASATIVRDWLVEVALEYDPLVPREEPASGRVKSTGGDEEAFNGRPIPVTFSRGEHTLVWGFKVSDVPAGPCLMARGSVANGTYGDAFDNSKPCQDESMGLPVVGGTPSTGPATGKTLPFAGFQHDFAPSKDSSPRPEVDITHVTTRTEGSDVVHTVSFAAPHAKDGAWYVEIKNRVVPGILVGQAVAVSFLDTPEGTRARGERVNGEDFLVQATTTPTSVTLRYPANEVPAKAACYTPEVTVVWGQATNAATDYWELAGSCGAQGASASTGSLVSGDQATATSSSSSAPAAKPTPGPGAGMALLAMGAALALAVRRR
jgi:hypothetical protein